MRLFPSELPRVLPAGRLAPARCSWRPPRRDASPGVSPAVPRPPRPRRLTCRAAPPGPRRLTCRAAPPGPGRLTCRAVPPGPGRLTCRAVPPGPRRHTCCAVPPRLLAAYQPCRAGTALAAHQPFRVTRSSAVPAGLPADTMWMRQPRSPGYLVGASTPYENGSARRRYPAGYGLARGNALLAQTPSLKGSSTQ
jgi:hypothetical protein